MNQATDMILLPPAFDALRKKMPPALAAAQVTKDTEAAVLQATDLIALVLTSAQAFCTFVEVLLKIRRAGASRATGDRAK